MNILNESKQRKREREREIQNLLSKIKKGKPQNWLWSREFPRLSRQQ